MPFEEQLRVWSIVISVATWVPLAIPLTVASLTQGRLARKGALVACTFVTSWLLPTALLLILVVPAVWLSEPLTQKILSEPHPSAILVQLQSLTKIINQYWYVVGQIAVPLTAAVASIPLSGILSRRLLPQSHGPKSAA